DGPGSLRAACRKKEPLWIVFEVSGSIELASYLNVSSYKTIDGRGQRIKLTGKGLRLKECEHVIVCNLEFEGGRGPDVDAIQIKPNSKHIWIDRCSLQDYDDGLIDITRESTNITISRRCTLFLGAYESLELVKWLKRVNCHFSNHDKTILIGGDPSNHGDRCMCVTIHHCFFDGTRQRHPRVRFAKVHLYNNYTRNWGIYAVCASVESQIYSQCNIYEAGQKKVAFKYLAEKVKYILHFYYSRGGNMGWLGQNSHVPTSLLKEQAGDRDEACSGCIISEGVPYLWAVVPLFQIS
ncbi:probable pectate lyase 4, partial [Tanacetum coccineum]